MTRSRDVPARIIDAAIEILATDRSVSMPLREVAARAGVTTGAIQHHFGDKQGLVLAALQQHGQRFADRLRARRGDHTPAPGAVVRAILTELLPLDEERGVEARVALTFERLAADDEALAAPYRERFMVLHDLLVEHLPKERPHLAELLLAAVGGLRSDILLGRIDGEHALVLVDRALHDLDAAAHRPHVSTSGAP